MKIDLVGCDVRDRELILVASDARYAQMQEAARSFDWGNLLRPFAAGAGMALASGVGLMTLCWPVGALALWKSLRQAAPSGALPELPLPHVAPWQAESLFTFEHGHPKDGGMYVVNPCRPRVYWVPATSEEKLAHEKHSAFLNICGKLGAKRISIESGAIATGSGAGGVKLRGMASQIGVSAKFKDDEHVERGVYQEFGEPRGPIVLPPQLSPDEVRWVESDSFLRQLVESRSSYSLREARYHFECGGMRTVDGGLRAAVAKFGISLGGTYRTVEVSTWEFAVEFWPAA